MLLITASVLDVLLDVHSVHSLASLAAIVNCGENFVRAVGGAAATNEERAPLMGGGDVCTACDSLKTFVMKVSLCSHRAVYIKLVILRKESFSTTAVKHCLQRVARASNGNGSRG